MRGGSLGIHPTGLTRSVPNSSSFWFFLEEEAPIVEIFTQSTMKTDSVSEDIWGICLPWTSTVIKSRGCVPVTGPKNHSIYIFLPWFNGLGHSSQSDQLSATPTRINSILFKIKWLIGYWWRVSWLIVLFLTGPLWCVRQCVTSLRGTSKQYHANQNKMNGKMWTIYLSFYNICIDKHEGSTTTRLSLRQNELT